MPTPACRCYDTILFYDEAFVKDAKVICNGCAQRQECLDEALLREDFGVWGGTTSEERRLIREQRGISLDKPKVEEHPRCGTNAGYHRLAKLRQLGFKVPDCEPCRIAHSHYQADKIRKR